MGISYRIVDGVLRTTVAGSAAADDVRAYLAAVRADSRYRPGMHTLVDCRTVATLLSSADLRSIAEEVRAMSPPSVYRRIAMLASTDVVFGLIRMYEAFAETSSLEVQAFRDECEAIAWLSNDRGTE
jgi:hypothetical protein